MKFIKPGYEILTPIDGIAELQFIEQAARTCYKSEDKIAPDGESAKKFIKMLIERGHGGDAGTQFSQREIYL